MMPSSERKGGYEAWRTMSERGEAGTDEGDALTPDRDAGRPRGASSKRREPSTDRRCAAFYSTAQCTSGVYCSRVLSSWTARARVCGLGAESWPGCASPFGLWLEPRPERGWLPGGAPSALPMGALQARVLSTSERGHAEHHLGNPTCAMRWFSCEGWRQRMTMRHPDLTGCMNRKK